MGALAPAGGKEYKALHARCSVWIRFSTAWRRYLQHTGHLPRALSEVQSQGAFSKPQNVHKRTVATIVNMAIATSYARDRHQCLGRKPYYAPGGHSNLLIEHYFVDSVGPGCGHFNFSVTWYAKGGVPLWSMLWLAPLGSSILTVTNSREETYLLCTLTQ